MTRIFKKWLAAELYRAAMKLARLTNYRFNMRPDQLQLSRQLIEAKKEVTRDRANGRLFLDKQKEYEQEARDDMIYRQSISEQLIKAPQDQKWIFELFLDT